MVSKKATEVAAVIPPADEWTAAKVRAECDAALRGLTQPQMKWAAKVAEAARAGRMLGLPRQRALIRMFEVVAKERNAEPKGALQDGDAPKS